MSKQDAEPLLTYGAKHADPLARLRAMKHSDITVLTGPECAAIVADIERLQARVAELEGSLRAAAHIEQPNQPPPNATGAR